MRALELAADDDNVRVVLLTGAGNRAFCAGAPVAFDSAQLDLLPITTRALYPHICSLVHVCVRLSGGNLSPETKEGHPAVCPLDLPMCSR